MEQRQGCQATLIPHPCLAPDFTHPLHCRLLIECCNHLLHETGHRSAGTRHLSLHTSVRPHKICQPCKFVHTDVFMLAWQDRGSHMMWGSKNAHHPWQPHSGCGQLHICMAGQSNCARDGLQKCTLARSSSGRELSSCSARRKDDFTAGCFSPTTSTYSRMAASSRAHALVASPEHQTIERSPLAQAKLSNFQFGKTIVGWE